MTINQLCVCIDKIISRSILWPLAARAWLMQGKKSILWIKIPRKIEISYVNSGVVLLSARGGPQYLAQTIVKVGFGPPQYLRQQESK